MRTISQKSQMTAEHYVELKWIQYNMEILEQTNTQIITSIVWKIIPNIQESKLVRNYKDWRRYALSFLDGWEQLFLINAALQVEVLEKKQSYSDQYYQLMAGYS